MDLDLEDVEKRLGVLSEAALQLCDLGSDQLGDTRSIAVMQSAYLDIFLSVQTIAPEELLAAGERLAHRYDPRTWAEDALRDLDKIIAWVPAVATVNRMSYCSVEGHWSVDRCRKAAKGVRARHRELQLALRIGGAQTPKEEWSVTLKMIVAISSAGENTIRNKWKKHPFPKHLAKQGKGEKLYHYSDVFQWWQGAGLTAKLPPEAEAKEIYNRLTKS